MFVYSCRLAMIQNNAPTTATDVGSTLASNPSTLPATKHRRMLYHPQLMCRSKVSLFQTSDINRKLNNPLTPDVFHVHRALAIYM